MAADLRAKGEQRKEAMCKIIDVLFVLALISLPAVNGAVLSIDLGSEWMKVAVVNLKPGQSPISIAINEMSKRKSPTLVAFSNGDRMLGEEAAGIAARYPERVYSRVRDLIGKPVTSVREILNENYLPFDVVEDSRGSGSIRIHDKQSIFRSEELLAMVLSYGRELAESHAKGTIKDAVITVPPYFGQAERRGLLDAAQMAGITVLALINEHSGAALQYGIDKDFQNESRHVVFYDMGANSVYASVVYYSAYSAKDRGKTLSYNQFQVQGVRWDSSLGGQTMEQSLVGYFADEFNKQLGSGVDVRQFPKSMAKLKKQVKRTKEILSANTEALLSVESLHNDLDFRTTITREKFEELCGSFWVRAVQPLKDVLADTGLGLEQIHAVELIGGATRVPKLQAILSDFLGKKSLDRHLDADEAVALGAALQAANLSDGFKLNRKLGMVDGASYSVNLKIDGASIGALDEVDELSGQQILVQRLKKLPSKIFRTLKNQKDDFKVTLLYDAAGLLPPGIINPEIASFRISGVLDAAKKYASYNLSAPIKTNLHFSLSRSGVIYLDKAETVVEISEWIDVPVKNNTLEANTTTGSTSSDDGKASTEEVKKQGLKSGNGEGKELEIDENTETLDADEFTGVGEPPQETLTAASPATKRKLRKRTIRVPLKIADLTEGPSRPLSDKDFSEALSRMEKLSQKDAEKRKTAEAKNSLEAYIYATKDKLESVDGIEKISTEKQRDALRADLSEAEDWLYMDGADASASEFKKKLGSLKSVGDSIFFRLEELQARPIALQFAHIYIQEVQETLKGWETTKPWLSQKNKDEVSKELLSLQQWLDNAESQQQKLEGHKEPFFTSSQVYAEVNKLKNQVAAVNRIPKPKPKIEKTPEKIITEEKQAESAPEQPVNDGDSAMDASAEEGLEGSFQSQKIDEFSELHDEL